MALDVSIVRLLSLNALIQCCVFPLNLEELLRGALEKLLLDRCTSDKDPSLLFCFFAPPLLAPGRLAFSLCDHASPFSAAQLSTLSRVSSSVSCVNVSNNGLTTFTRNPFWCLAKM